MPLTSVSSVWYRGGFVLIRQLADSGMGCLFLAGIVPIPPHTQDIMPIVSMEKLFT